MGPVPVVLDVDTGVDDALALLLAMRSPALELLAVTCVSGNVPVDQVVRNTLTVLDVAEAAPIPVGRGAQHPMLRRPRVTRSVHGADGLADLGLPAPTGRPVGPDAVDLLHDTLVSAGRPVTLVCLAPVTNVAWLLAVHRSAASWIERVVMVGGFNREHDPEAWAAVFGSGLEVISYDMDVFGRVAVDRPVAERLADGPAAVTRLAGRLLLHQSMRHGGGPARIGDAGAVAAVIASQGARTEADYAGLLLDGVT